MLAYFIEASCDHSRTASAVSANVHMLLYIWNVLKCAYYCVRAQWSHNILQMLSSANAVLCVFAISFISAANIEIMKVRLTVY